MRDKRPVDELSIEELEKILAIRKREEREKRLDRMKRSGRVVGAEAATVATSPSAPIPQIPGVTIPAVPDVVMSATAASPVMSEPMSTRVGYSAAPQFEDEHHSPARTEDRSRFWKNFVNQSMFLVEALAVVGLLFLGYQMINAQSKLQQ